MSGATVMPKDEYFSGARQEVASLVPQGTQSVLDVGCGFGGLGQSLRRRGITRLWGIEVNPEAPAHLDSIYDRYWIGDVENVTLPSDLPLLDCIVFADVLEHLVDPWGALSRYVKYLDPQGCVVASIPNVRNMALLFNLLFRGRWNYTSSGLLDRGHLRFFTRHEIEEMFDNAGLVIERFDTNKDHYTLLRRLATAIPRMLIPDLVVCQFLVRARKKQKG